VSKGVLQYPEVVIEGKIKFWLAGYWSAQEGRRALMRARLAISKSWLISALLAHS
jgi:hypothetical protein